MRWTKPVKRKARRNAKLDGYDPLLEKSFCLLEVSPAIDTAWAQLQI